MRILVPFLCLMMAGLVACNHKDDNRTFQLNHTFTIDQGQTSSWEENNAVQVRFDRVLEDSRCPIDAICVWAGRAEVELTFSQPGDTQTTVLILGDPTGTEYSDQAVFGDFKVKLKKVDPQPRANQPIPQAEYSIQLEVEK